MIIAYKIKKCLLILIFLIGFFTVKAQRDFDYTIYTRYNICNFFMKNDSVFEERDSEKQIIKSNNLLKIVDIYCTANTMEYKLDFQGFSWMGKENGYKYLDNREMEMFFSYTSGDIKHDNYFRININPVTAVIIITKSNDKKYLDKFY